MEHVRLDDRQKVDRDKLMECLGKGTKGYDLWKEIDASLKLTTDQLEEKRRAKS